MKIKSILCVFLFSIITLSCKGVLINNKLTSQVEVNSLNVKYLSVICKTWGLMKYYHPNVISGEYDWDKELFNAINKISESKSDCEFKANLLSWIKSYGPIQIDEKVNRKDNLPATKVKMTNDFDWIESALIPEEARLILKSIVSHQNDGISFYVKKTVAGGAQFTNENVYNDLTNPDLGFRLLTLFRYWNYIEYFYPYKYLASDWNSVLEDFIPMMYKSYDEIEYRKILWELFSKINDSHANLITDSIWSDFKGVNNLPIKLSRINNKFIIVDSYSENQMPDECFLPGDELIIIDGIAVDSLFHLSSDYIPSSNLKTKYRDFLLDLPRSNKKRLEITFIRDGILHSKKCILRKNNESYFFDRLPVPKISFMDFDSIAYVNLCASQQVDLINLIDKKIIIADLRGSISNDVENFLEISDLIPYYTKFAISSEIDNYKPGRFIINENAATLSTGKDRRFKGELILLVNEFTQSNSEFMAMLYQSLPNTLTVGSQTAGTDGNMTFVDLPGGIKTAFTGVGIYYPDGSETQKVGIKINKDVEQSLEDVIKGRDTQLETVFQMLNIKM